MGFLTPDGWIDGSMDPEAQPEGVRYLWNSYDRHSTSANTLPLIGQGNLLDATQCGSGAHRNTRIWQNLLPHDILEAEHARLLPPTCLLPPS